LNHITHAAIPGAATAPNILTPEQVLAGAPVGETVIVYDCEGYFMGVGLAELLRSNGAHVSLVTPLQVIAPFLDHTDEGEPVRQHLVDLGVSMVTDTQLVSIEFDQCVLRSYGRETREQCDSLVLATARVSDSTMYRELRRDIDALARNGIEAVYAIGDCVAPRLIADCVFDGHRLAREIDSPTPHRPLPFRRERRVLEHPASVPGS
jgi:dimethylamine/trimethylamine dehydrogenase